MKCDSLVSLGKYQSNDDQAFEGANVPLGKMFKQNSCVGDTYNQYIIFDNNQFILRYIAFIKCAKN